MDEVVQMPKCYYAVMQLEYRNRHCMEKECWNYCNHYACTIAVERIEE